LAGALFVLFGLGGPAAGFADVVADREAFGDDGPALGWVISWLSVSRST
jgi:hypothetical protein